MNKHKHYNSAALEEIYEEFVNEEDQFITDYFEKIKHEKGAYPSGYTVKKKEAYLNKIRKVLNGNQDVEYLSNGLDLIIKECENSNNYPRLKADLVKIKDKFIKENTGDAHRAGEHFKIFDSLQDMLHMTNGAIEDMYAIAMHYYHRHQNEKTRSILYLVTQLNPFIFDPWFLLGICFFKEHEVLQAVYAFGMAALIDLKNPFPNLYSAQCYMNLDQKENAKKSYELALDLMTKEEVKQFKDTLSILKSYVH